MLEWQWAVPRSDIPDGLSPMFGPRADDGERPLPALPPEWTDGIWAPTPATDQWQLAATCFVALTGEEPPATDIPPVLLLRPECPASVATAIDRALLPHPDERFDSITALMRVADRGYASRTTLIVPEAGEGPLTELSHEARVRWALGDDYEVLSDLGSGSFGRVWRARDLSLEREVALKVLHPHIARDGRAVGAFWREAKLAAQLAHPAIVPIYDWDSRGDLSWYTMELAEEGSVASLIARSGPRELTEIAEPIEMVLGGLAAAHGVGIVHRDLKPENILIDRYRRWRITDFGIANVTGEEIAGTTGTPAFAAPEQLLGEPHGAAADLFSVAGIVVFALSGEPPFGDGDPQEIVARQLSRRIDLTSYPATVSEWLRIAFSPDPDERFTDATAMMEAWRQAAKIAIRRERSGWWWRSAAE